MSLGATAFLLLFLEVLAVFVILDIEYPRLGLVRVDAFDQVVDLRERMDRDVQESGQR